MYTLGEPQRAVLTALDACQLARPGRHALQCLEQQVLGLWLGSAAATCPPATSSTANPIYSCGVSDHGVRPGAAPVNFGPQRRAISSHGAFHGYLRRADVDAVHTPR